MLIPRCSLKMRLKKTCGSWRWIWPELSVGLPLGVGSRVHLSPSCAQHPLNPHWRMLSAEVRLSLPAPAGSPSAHGQHRGSTPYPCGVQAGPWPRGQVARVGGHPTAPRAPFTHARPPPVFSHTAQLASWPVAEQCRRLVHCWAVVHNFCFS